MKFKKGSKVEVFSRKDASSGAWRCGEIISRHGRTYTIKYDCPPGMENEDTVVMVSRKAIRPRPLAVDCLDLLNAGDVVEVFDDLSWKTATVLKAISENYYLVTLHASSIVLTVNKVNIRVHQSWQDGRWVAIGKGSSSCEDMKSSKLSTLSNYQKMSSMPQANAKITVPVGEKFLAVEKNISFQTSCVVSAKTLKRPSPFSSSDVDAHNGKAQKMRAIEKRGELEQIRSVYPSTVLEKVDAVTYPREYLGEMNMHAPNNQTFGSYEKERGTPNHFFESFDARTSEPNDFDIDACSVGSCSVSSQSPNKMSNRNLEGNTPEADTCSSDAESFCHCGDDEEKGPLPLGEDVPARIHRLELHAYRCTLEALYASGPLSWEQETLLTNLRMSLNISNDEHLMELKNLISARTSIHDRAAVGGKHALLPSFLR